MLLNILKKRVAKLHCDFVKFSASFKMIQWVVQGWIHLISSAEQKARAVD